MGLIFQFQFAIFALLTAHVVSTDRSLRRLRRQPSNHLEVAHSNSYREEVEDEIYLELWERWLQKDQSMKTTAPIAPIPPTTRQPTKSPVRPPLSLPTNAPVTSKAPLTPPFPTMPGSLSPFSRAPVAVPKAAPVVAPSASPSIFPSQNPSISPFSKAPTSSAPVTKVPTSSVPVTKVPTSSAPVTKAPTSQAPVPPPTAPRGTLLQFVQSVAELSTLLTAITTSDANRNMPPFFLEVLNSTNTSITLFAPVNAGFTNLAQIVPGYLTQLLTPNFGLHLFEIIAYHATPGIILSSTFPRTNLRMLAGGTVNVTAGTSFAVQSSSTAPAQILPPPDVRATNGVSQVVNNVLLPQFVFFNLFEGLQFANSQGQFSTLLRLIAAAGLEATLAEATGVTLIAPVNSGITAITETFLLQPGNEAILSDVMRYHVLTELFNFAAQKTSTVDLYDTLLQGARVVVGVVPMADGGVFTRYNQAVQSGYSLARESILYTVDRLLIPPLLRPVVPGVIFTNSTPVTANTISDGDAQHSKIKWVPTPLN